MGSDPTEQFEDHEQTDAEFILFVEETLVPDLRQLGSDEVANDFERLIDIIRSEERWLELAEDGFVNDYHPH